LIHAGRFQWRKSAVQQEKIAVKYRFFEALAKLQDAVKKRPVFHNYLVVKNEENSCKIREFFFLLKHPNNNNCLQKVVLFLRPALFWGPLCLPTFSANYTGPAFNLGARASIPQNCERETNFLISQVSLFHLRVLLEVGT